MIDKADRDEATLLPSEMVMRRHDCQRSGLSITAMPPGSIQISWMVPSLTLNLGSSKGADVALQRIDGVDFPSCSSRPGGFDIAAPGGRMELDATNRGWECLVELDAERIDDFAPEMLDGHLIMPEPIAEGTIRPPPRFPPWQFSTCVTSR